MDEPVDWNKLGRILAGEYGGVQERETTTWMRAEAGCKLLAEVLQIWDLARETRHNPDVEVAWREVAKKARVYARDPLLRDRSPLRHTNKCIVTALSIAAFISLVVCAVLLVRPAWHDAVPVVRIEPVDISMIERRGATRPALFERQLKFIASQFHCERA